MNITGIILAGGQGRRLGFIEKGLLVFKGTTLVSNKIEQLDPFCDEIIIVTNKPDLYTILTTKKIRIIQDNEPYHGPLMGLYCGLNSSINELCFLTAVDMPEFSMALFTNMLSRIEACDIVVPESKGFIEPMFGFYKRCIVTIIKDLLNDNKNGIQALIKKTRTEIIDEYKVTELINSIDIFRSINTPDDLQLLS